MKSVLEENAKPLSASGANVELGLLSTPNNSRTVLSYWSCVSRAKRVTSPGLRVVTVGVGSTGSLVGETSGAVELAVGSGATISVELPVVSSLWAATAASGESGDRAVGGRLLVGRNAAGTRWESAKRQY